MPASELDEALDDTIEAIEKSATAHLVGYDIKAEVMQSARHAWRQRYTPKYQRAIDVDKRVWKHDKADVLERAGEVGKLAAFIALGVSIIEETVRAGLGRKPGQDIELLAAQRPRIDSSIANAAAAFLDCQPAPGTRWDWCSIPAGQPIGAVSAALLARILRDVPDAQKKAIAVAAAMQAD